MSKSGKQYGLIIPKKPQNAVPSFSNIFGDDGGSDEEDGTDWVRKALKAEGEKNKVKKQTKLNMQKALKEDPTIYQYDEVYDDMERTKHQSKIAKQEDKRPKYIENLLKAADRRKKEQEHRIERMVQKERETEGDMYADKESFVTSAYRAKLEEFKKLEEEEARMNRLETIGDVTKQQDLSGFYRHLYEQTIEKPQQTKDGCEGEQNETFKQNLKTERLDEVTIIHDKPSEGIVNKDYIPSKVKRSRQYRQRVIEAENSDSEGDSQSKVSNDQNCDPSASVNEVEKAPEEPESKRLKQDIHEEQKSQSEIQDKAAREEASAPKRQEENIPVETDPDIQIESDKIKAKEKLQLAKKERSRIWEKRTIGPIFEAALQRYYARKAARLSAT